jgi:mxaJ protein
MKPTLNKAMCLLGLVLVTILFSTSTWAEDSTRQLGVCGDPDNLPFSNDHLQGFENKIVTIIAKDLNASVQYMWLSQRGRFVGKTLDARKCELVLGVPTRSDLVLTTKPYYRSSYVFVYRKNKHELQSLDDPILSKMRIGIHAFGENGTSPVTIALAKRGLADHIVGFTILHTDDSPKGQIIDAIAAGDIDVAIVWGPFGGYFAKHQPVKMKVVPVNPGSNVNSIPFAFDISIGVRHGNIALKNELEGVLERRHKEIHRLLAEFSVPILNAPPASLAESRSQHNPTQRDVRGYDLHDKPSTQ